MNHPTERVGDEAAAVEDELVLSADEVHVRDRDALSRRVGQALWVRVPTKGRRRRAGEHPRPGGHERRAGVGAVSVVPEVLAEERSEAVAHQGASPARLVLAGERVMVPGGRSVALEGRHPLAIIERVACQHLVALELDEGAPPLEELMEGPLDSEE